MAPAIEDARAACDGCRWGDAWRLLRDVPLDDLDVDDLDRLATAAYLTGHDREGFAGWVRAHQRCAEAGEVHRAAHFGVKLAQGLGFQGDIARCRGWIDRTARLLHDAGIDCVEQGYLEHGLAMLRVFDAGDMAGAHAHFVQAGKIGARFAHHELVALARIGEGRMLIYLGEVGEGLARLDEAVVAVEAGELRPMAAGDAYCTVIDACAELADLGRCRAWTESFVRWCDGQQDLVLYRGHCFLHRAEVLGTLGRWGEALREARRANDRLAAPVNVAALASARVVEGDLLRLVGDLDGAEISYDEARDLGRDPQPGLALLRLAQGRPDAAGAMARRALGEAQGPVARARLLPAVVEIALAVGDLAGATTGADDLHAVASELGTPLLRARAARAAGAVRLAGGDPAAALVLLRRAFDELLDLGARHEAARTRLLVAEACEALGDHDTARLDAAAAHSALAALAAERDDRPTGLSPRELEVLRLLARGRTNRSIAEALFISEKTVASHVSHIFTKLGVTTRSAATAHAYDRSLL